MLNVIATVIGSAAVFLLGWIFTSIEELNQTVTKQSQQLIHMQVSIEAATRDSYRGADAERDFSLINERIENLQRRVFRLEERKQGDVDNGD